MTDPSLRPKKVEIFLGACTVLAMLLTAFFLLDMKWIAQPLYVMAAAVARLFGGA